MILPLATALLALTASFSSYPAEGARDWRQNIRLQSGLVFRF